MRHASLALVLCLAACGAPLAERYAAGNRALSEGEGPVYFVVISPILQRELNRCIPPGTEGASPTLVVVADVDANGRTQDVEVQPSSAGRDCLRQALRDAQLPKPPLAAGQERFPIGLRVDTR